MGSQARLNAAGSIRLPTVTASYPRASGVPLARVLPTALPPAPTTPRWRLATNGLQSPAVAAMAEPASLTILLGRLNDRPLEDFGQRDTKNPFVILPDGPVTLAGSLFQALCVLDRIAPRL